MSKIKPWIALDIGCYECGEPDGVLGFFDTKETAQGAVDRAEERQGAHWHGQHDMKVWNLTNPPLSEWRDDGPGCTSAWCSKKDNSDGS